MDLEEPPIAPDVTLRDFPFMPLHVQLLRDSYLAMVATGDEFRAAVLLWCAAWHQVPAGSLPDDDRVLAALVGYGRGDAALEQWSKVREMALHGFKKGPDGRLYHGVVVEYALEAWERKGSISESRSKHASKMRDWRSKKKERREKTKHNQENESALQSRDSHAPSPRDANVTSMIGQGQGQGQKNISPPSGDGGGVIGASDGAAYPPEFEAFWKLYPRKVRKDGALRAWRAARKRIGKDADAVLMAGVKAYANRVAGKDQQFIAHASTWLNQGGWADEEASAATAAMPINQRPGNQLGIGG